MNPIARRVLTGLLIAGCIVAAVVFVPRCVVAPAVAVLTLLALLEYTLLFRRKVPRPNVLSLLGYLTGAAVIILGLAALPVIALRHGNLMLLYILAIVKFSDTGGFALGLSSARLQKGGNHKLCPSVSPNKSWEGLFGSLLFSVIVSCAFMPLTEFGWLKALAFGVAAALVGTAGDLLESKFKRWVGVKDSSALKATNGLGGVLDMLDSLLLAPVVLLPFI